jgi:MFS family permease
MNDTKLLTPRFVLVVACGLCYFIALAMLTPVLPHYVEDKLHNGSLAVGVAVGAFAFGAIALRAFAGRAGDAIGRRVLIIFGAAVVAISTAFYGLIPSLWWLVTMRVVTGFGEAGFFVGAATMVTDLAPVERRGEALSYWSVAVYGGLSFGPAIGDFLRGGGRYALTFGVSCAFATVAALLGLATRDVPREREATAPTKLFNRAALRPGSVLFLGLIPLAAFTAFIPLYVDGLGVSAGLIFLLYGTVILGVRIFGARIPDRVGARRTATVALAVTGTGIGIVAAWATVAGLVVGTIVFALGMSLLYPALLVLALRDAPDSERGSVVGTFSSFFDAATGFGALLAGAIAAVTGNRGAFAAGAVACLFGLVVLRTQAAAPVVTA